jgi:uncharacterized protein (DUF2252 family)
MLPLDPLELARRQLASDRETTSRFRGLFERKLRRMSASPLAFLRGAAPLFYSILAERPFLAEGPEGEGWLTGDMHLENFGAYRPDPHSFAGSGTTESDARATFDLNDFDDAIIGPLRLDVLRLTTSLILGGRELGADGVTTLELCDRLLDAYGRAAFGTGRIPSRPGPVRALVQQVRERTRKGLLEGRTLRKGKLRHFVRDDPDDRYRELPRAIRAELPRAFARYVATLRAVERPSDPRALEILDSALRIAGTGSLGRLRIAVLVRGKGGRDGGWIFDLKEQGEPSASLLLGKPLGDPATRVVTAARACLAHPPRMLGTTTLGGRSMFVRRLAPQEDKLELTRTNRYGDVSHAIHHLDLGPLAEYLGAILGRAHRRAARRPLGRPWSRVAKRGIVHRAITIAGLHEAVYLSVCKLQHSYLANR